MIPSKMNICIFISLKNDKNLSLNMDLYRMSGCEKANIKHK